jgi:hypothetical protein
VESLQRPRILEPVEASPQLQRVLNHVRFYGFVKLLLLLLAGHMRGCSNDPQPVLVASEQQSWENATAEGSSITQQLNSALCFPRRQCTLHPLACWQSDRSPFPVQLCQQ